MAKISYNELFCDKDFQDDLMEYISSSKNKAASIVAKILAKKMKEQTGFYCYHQVLYYLFMEYFKNGSNGDMTNSQYRHTREFNFFMNWITQLEHNKEK